MAIRAEGRTAPSCVFVALPGSLSEHYCTDMLVFRDYYLKLWRSWVAGCFSVCCALNLAAHLGFVGGCNMQRGGRGGWNWSTVRRMMIIMSSLCGLFEIESGPKCAVGSFEELSIEKNKLFEWNSNCIQFNKKSSRCVVRTTEGGSSST